jgi:4-amino-4-deoxy-L-arabinose transferase-like glycosyltransferase
MDYRALFEYWQYLDVETLKTNLIKGIWFDHAQPPFFNLLLGMVVKISGQTAPVVFSALFKLISLINILLLYTIIIRVTGRRNITLAISLLYLLSPALMIFEAELFYTTFISMLLLISTFFLLDLEQKPGWKSVLGFFLPLALVCLTRSMYHLVWLIVIGITILFYYRKNLVFKRLFTGFLLSLFLVGGWYVKNLIVFGEFSTSSWIGMNLARNVFHDHPITDSSRIEAIEPFSRISLYKPFITGANEKKYAGINDRDLLKEFKNDTLLNLNHIDYLEVSTKYKQVSVAYMKANPFNYLKNVLQSCIIFFAPATRYPHAEEMAKKIKYYDVIYSFNLSHFAGGKEQRRIALTLSALPKLVIYLLVFGALIQGVVKQRTISALQLFIIATIFFVFVVSSLIEHYENMRFRYEIEPLFLILMGIAMAKRFKVYGN